MTDEEINELPDEYFESLVETGYERATDANGNQVLDSEKEVLLTKDTE